MSKRKRLTSEAYAEGIKNGDRAILSQAITLVESRNIEDHRRAVELLDLIVPYTGNTMRLGISGVPGVGKSTFIESFGSFLTSQKHSIAVLAVDPTSQRTRGSILGDKTRMEKLSSDPKAYIRPTAAGSTLGGVGSATRESMLLCEAAGFDIIIVETVGVGQSETVVREMVDFFLLLMLAGAGDELQGMKRGIMEMADAIVINKADGENLQPAKRARAEYQSALHYMPPAPNEWQPQVLTCSSFKNVGIDAIWELIENYFFLVKKNGWLSQNRREQNLHWLHQKLNFLIREKYFNDPGFKEALKEAENQVMNQNISPASAAQKLVGMMGSSEKKD
jgi:LAO/AO transport system kinase